MPISKSTKVMIVFMGCRQVASLPVPNGAGYITFFHRMNYKINREIQWIFLDCMETLVDMNPIPGIADYARWTYQHSGTDRLWHSFDRFRTEFELATSHIRYKLPQSPGRNHKGSGRADCQ